MRHQRVVTAALLISCVITSGANAQHRFEGFGWHVVADPGTNSLVAYTLDTGRALVLSGPGVGSGPDFPSSGPYYSEWVGGMVFVTSPAAGGENGSLFRVDYFDGDRQQMEGDGPALQDPRGMYSIGGRGGERALLLVDAGLDALLSVDPFTGSRTIISGPDRGEGPSLIEPIFVEPSGIQVGEGEFRDGYAVADKELGIVYIDPLTGDRSLGGALPIPQVFGGDPFTTFDATLPGEVFTDGQSFLKGTSALPLTDMRDRTSFMLLDAGTTPPFLIGRGGGYRLEAGEILRLAPYAVGNPPLVNPTSMLEKELITDFNGCGCVDASQALIMFTDWGQPSQVTDLNLDGTVDAADFIYLYSEWPFRGNIVADSGDVSVVPEPRSCWPFPWMPLLVLAIKGPRSRGG